MRASVALARHCAELRPCRLARITGKALKRPTRRQLQRCMSSRPASVLRLWCASPGRRCVLRRLTACRCRSSLPRSSRARCSARTQGACLSWAPRLQPCGRSRKYRMRCQLVGTRRRTGRGTRQVLASLRRASRGTAHLLGSRFRRNRRTADTRSPQYLTSMPHKPIGAAKTPACQKRRLTMSANMLLRLRRRLFRCCWHQSLQGGMAAQFAVKSLQRDPPSS